MMSRRTTVPVAVLGLVVLGIGLLGLPPGPAALPPGASALTVATEAPEWRLPGMMSCPLALLGPVQIERAGGAIVFVSIVSGARGSIVWPHGFSGRLVDGHAELVEPDGTVVGREGDTLSHIGGGTAPDSAFHVCGSGPWN